VHPIASAAAERNRKEDRTLDAVKIMQTPVSAHSAGRLPA